MNYKFFFLTILILLISACSKEMELEYVVTNDSDRTAFIEFKKNESDPLQRSRLPMNKGLVFYIEPIKRSKINDEIEYLESLPFAHLAIVDSLDNAPSCDVFDISCWQKQIRYGGNEYPKIQYYLRNRSFQ